MTIRPAMGGDLAAVERVLRECPEAAQWPAGDTLAQHCTVAEDESEIAGFLAARTITPGEHEILNVAVAPRWRRRGVGQALLADFVLRWPGDCFLEVRESNEPARRLYERSGFRVTGRRLHYYRDPDESALIMARP